jgi:hypothetical protein
VVENNAVGGVTGTCCCWGKRLLEAHETIQMKSAGGEACIETFRGPSQIRTPTLRRHTIQRRQPFIAGVCVCVCFLFLVLIEVMLEGERGEAKNDCRHLIG